MIAMRAIPSRSAIVHGRFATCISRNSLFVVQPRPSLLLSSSSSSTISTTTRLQFRTSIFSRRSLTAEGGQGVTAKSVPVEKTSRWTWSRIALYVKAIRVPFLIVAIYGLGYRQGIADTVRNPLKLQQGTFETLLIEMGVTEEDEVDIVSERRVRGFSTLEWFMGTGMASSKTKKQDPRTEKVAKVGSEIIQVARRYVRQQLGEAVEKAKEQYNDAFIKEDVLARKLNSDPKVEFWILALERIEGAALEGIDNWQYVLVDTPVPNAFVSEMLPQRFFVTTGLFKEFVDNDDELAMVLGHEISHLILGHLSQSSMLETFLRGFEIVILMLDPTEGLLSLGKIKWARYWFGMNDCGFIGLQF
jgi:Peptidase family M48